MDHSVTMAKTIIDPSLFRIARIENEFPDLSSRVKMCTLQMQRP